MGECFFIASPDYKKHKLAFLCEYFSVFYPVFVKKALNCVISVVKSKS